MQNLYNQPTGRERLSIHKEEKSKAKKRLEFIEFKFAKHSVRCLKEDSKFLYNFSQPFKRCQKIQIFQFNFHHDHNWLFEKIFYSHFSKTTSQCTSQQLSHSTYNSISLDCVWVSNKTFQLRVKQQQQLLCEV